MPKPKPPVKKHTTFLDWVELREEWILSQLIGGSKALTLNQLADNHGIGHSTVYNKSSHQKWGAILDERKKANDNVVVKTLADRSERAIDIVQLDFANREAEIRYRHVQMAKGLQAKAMKRIGAVDIDKITVRDALTMLQIGINEERYAMGMPETYNAPPRNDGLHPEYKPLVQQLQGHRKVQDVAIELLKKLKERGVSEAVILNEVGLGDNKK